MLHLLALYPLVRGVFYVGLLLLIGSQGADKLIMAEVSNPVQRVPMRRALQALVQPLALLMVVFILARGLLQVLSFLDPGDPITWPLVEAALVTSGWGIAWLTALVASALLAIVLATHLGTRRWLVVTLLLVLIAAQTGTGHAGGSQWPGPTGRLLDGLHLAGAGTWLGTLGMLTAIAMPQLRDDSDVPVVAALIHRFSWYARTGALLVVISGLTATLVYARSPGLFIHSTWGHFLLVKLAAMTGVLGLGWYNWRRVTPELQAASCGATARLRRAVRIELALGVVMLAVTALLVVSPLPGE
ncbi:MAG TPA: CopD family protein [Gemmatimonadales bacterium]|jgi:putative copper resistance protein D